MSFQFRRVIAPVGVSRRDWNPIIECGLNAPSSLLDFLSSEWIDLPER